ADCRTHQNRPTCVCPPGMTGNPTIECKAVKSVSFTPLPPIGQSSDFDDVPIAPIKDEHLTKKPVPEYPSFLDEPTPQHFMPDLILPLIVVSCSNNDDCLTDHSCINSLCYDVCALGVC
ncbi:hypothetical protein FHG87_018687, partial [Trinorchestia longiramus]